MNLYDECIAEIREKIRIGEPVGVKEALAVFESLEQKRRHRWLRILSAVYRKVRL